ncbi:hypothetical protein DFJ58DRAFT_757180 [Suillus subalutaceus]|uniref:uncharacterized protein n=1 Tax=Suillus subalutaceus TaxID=48586 RepID=UPI001B883F3F|nr:uncharacterized protein DFJ58DRAFT_757180 [Suillus subalutaceus]KAG1875626.1 hypothetical protein DFJ58DRAFT_757180 [Suillus subalutaceus]
MRSPSLLVPTAILSLTLSVNIFLPMYTAPAASFQILIYPSSSAHCSHQSSNHKYDVAFTLPVASTHSPLRHLP